MFLAKVRGEHHETEEVVESKTMVYMIEGDIILVSKAVLETLGCIPKTFPKVGELLTDDDAALTGRAFAANTDPIRLMSDGTKDPNIRLLVQLMMWPVRPARPARWVGQNFTHQRCLGRSSRRKT